MRRRVCGLPDEQGLVGLPTVAGPPDYGGWSTYPTWAVYLWLTSEPQSSAQCSDLAEAALLTPDEHGTAGGCPLLAAALEAEVRARIPLPCGASLYRDLLNAALAEVDWLSLAAEFLGEAVAVPD